MVTFTIWRWLLKVLSTSIQSYAEQLATKLIGPCFAEQDRPCTCHASRFNANQLCRFCSWKLVQPVAATTKPMSITGGWEMIKGMKGQSHHGLNFIALPLEGRIVYTGSHRRWTKCMQLCLANIDGIYFPSTRTTVTGVHSFVGICLFYLTLLEFCELTEDDHTCLPVGCKSTVRQEGKQHVA